MVVLSSVSRPAGQTVAHACMHVARISSVVLRRTTEQRVEACWPDRCACLHACCRDQQRCAEVYYRAACRGLLARPLHMHVAEYLAGATWSAACFVLYVQVLLMRVVPPVEARCGYKHGQPESRLPCVRDCYFSRRLHQQRRTTCGALSVRFGPAAEGAVPCQSSAVQW
jgi:hypothetical protein